MNGPYHARVIRRRATRSGLPALIGSWRWEIRIYRNRRLLSLSGSRDHASAVWRAHAIVTRLNQEDLRE